MIKNRYTAAITDKPWWLAGGIPQSACVAAYQFKGASSYLASLHNLSKPNTYTLTAPGGELPTWSVNNGMTFADAADYLQLDWDASGYVHNRSAIVKFIAANSYNLQTVFGTRNNFYLRYVTGTPNYHWFINGAVEYQYSGGISDGVACISDKYYLNGVYLGNATNALTTLDYNKIAIGSLYGATSQGMVGSVQAIAFYTTSLSQSQVSALTNAMNAL